MDYLGQNSNDLSYNKRSDWLIDYQCEANLHVVCKFNKECITCNLLIM